LSFCLDGFGSNGLWFIWVLVEEGFGLDEFGLNGLGLGVFLGLLVYLQFLDPVEFEASFGFGFHKFVSWFMLIDLFGFCFVSDLLGVPVYHKVFLAFMFILL